MINAYEVFVIASRPYPEKVLFRKFYFTMEEAEEAKLKLPEYIREHTRVFKAHIEVLDEEP